MERTIQHMMVTSFWHPDGTPMSAQQFLELLFGRLPNFFRDEAELRTIWGSPGTRAKLLAGLAEQGFGAELLTEMQSIIDAPDSDLFDVLAHVAWALPPVTREERARYARNEVGCRFPSRQQQFIEFVLGHYVNERVRELDQDCSNFVIGTRSQTPSRILVLPRRSGACSWDFSRFYIRRSERVLT